MNKTLLVVVAAAGVSVSCIPYALKKEPPGRQIAPEVESPPPIQLSITEATLGFEEKPSKKLRERASRAIDRAVTKLPFLAAASEEVADPAYRIELAVRRRGTDNMELCQISMCLFPGFLREQVLVTASITRPDGQPLDTASASREVRYVTQFHLMYTVPVTLPLSAILYRRLMSGAVRAALIQAGQRIEADRRGAAVTASAVSGGRP